MERFPQEGFKLLARYSDVLRSTSEDDEGAKDDANRQTWTFYKPGVCVKLLFSVL